MADELFRKGQRRTDSKRERAPKFSESRSPVLGADRRSTHTWHPASHAETTASLRSAKDKDAAAKLVLSVTDRTASARESRSTCCHVVASLAARKFGLYNAVPQNYNFDTKSELHLGNSFEAYSLARLQHQNIRRTPPKLTGHRSTFDHLDSKDFRTLPFAA